MYQHNNQPTNLPYIIVQQNNNSKPVYPQQCLTPNMYQVVHQYPSSTIFQPQNVFGNDQNMKVFVFDNNSSQSALSASLDVKKATRIHRFMLKQTEIQQLSFRTFVELLINKSILKVSENAAFDLFFMDDENEWVSLSNDNEWGVLWCVLKGEKVIKIALVRRENKKIESQTNVATSSSTEIEKSLSEIESKRSEETISVHELIGLISRNRAILRDQIEVEPDNGIPHIGVHCDGCGEKNFVGKRWKCTDCQDFDLCGKCFDENMVSGEHAEGFHSFDQIQPSEYLYGLVQQCENNVNDDVDDVTTTVNTNDEEESSTIILPNLEEEITNQQTSNFASTPAFEQELVAAEEETTTTTEQQFTSLLKVLKEMGFIVRDDNDEEELQKLFHNCGGDIEKTISALCAFY